MTSRGDTALFQGAAVGVAALFGFSAALNAIPTLFDCLGGLGVAALLYGGGGLVGGLWAFMVWKRGTAAARKARGLCVKCGYDLTGNMSGTCPECGRAIQ